jgi:hypothetical protein
MMHPRRKICTEKFIRRWRDCRASAEEFDFSGEAYHEARVAERHDGSGRLISKAFPNRLTILPVFMTQFNFIAGA